MIIWKLIYVLKITKTLVKEFKINNNLNLALLSLFLDLPYQNHRTRNSLSARFYSITLSRKRYILEVKEK